MDSSDSFVSVQCIPVVAKGKPKKNIFSLQKYYSGGPLGL